MTARYDVVVAGGGIHGVGIAQAAAAAGFSVLLLEQSALAAGSSSRSSKLIHGGLRYLESGQLRLVHESLRERALLLRLAPELVHLQKFYHSAVRAQPPQVLAAAHWTFAVRAAGRPRLDALISAPCRAAEWGSLDGLDLHGLRQVFWYHDAQTDDALLTGAVMRSAQSLGAELAMPARFTGATLTDDGVQVRYEQAMARSRMCARACWSTPRVPGPTSLARTITPAISVPALELVQGTHLLLDGPPRRGVYYLESPRDGRAIFVMPFRGQLMVGTTEVRFHGDPSTVAPGPHEVHYLLGVLRHYFPRFRDAAASAAARRVRRAARACPPAAATPSIARAKRCWWPTATPGRACYRSMAANSPRGARCRRACSRGSRRRCPRARRARAPTSWNCIRHEPRRARPRPG